MTDAPGSVIIFVVLFWICSRNTHYSSHRGAQHSTGAQPGLQRGKDQLLTLADNAHGSLFPKSTWLALVQPHVSQDKQVLPSQAAFQPVSHHHLPVPEFIPVFIEDHFLFLVFDGIPVGHKIYPGLSKFLWQHIHLVYQPLLLLYCLQTCSVCALCNHPNHYGCSAGLDPVSALGVHL